MALQGNWTYPTAIRFGAGRIREIGAACAAAGISRPLLVTDRGLAEREITARTRDLMEEAGLGRAIFAEVDANPTGENLARALEIYRAGGFDGVIAFGGGSGLDLGKTVAFMAGQTRPVWDFEDVGDWWTRADPTGIHPIVAVPTTAGTGSEVGRAAVLTKADTREKKIVFHPAMLPAQVICDPDLTLGLPPAITAGTGLDARPLRRGLFQPALPPDEPRHRAGEDAPGQDLPAARPCGRHRHRGARPDDERGDDGRHRLPEGAGRDPRAEPPYRRAPRHPSRHHQRGLHARRAALQRPRHRRPFRPGGGLSGTSRLLKKSALDMFFGT